MRRKKGALAQGLITEYVAVGTHTQTALMSHLLGCV